MKEIEQRISELEKKLESLTRAYLWSGQFVGWDKVLKDEYEKNHEKSIWEDISK